MTLTSKSEDVTRYLGAIREAITTKGVNTPSGTHMSLWEGNILAIPQEGGTSTTSFGASWGRSSERPALPFNEDTGPEEGTMYLLFGATATAINDFAIYFGGGMGFIYWPDGYTQGFAAVTVERIFDYDALDVIPDSNGVKWVWIKVVFNAASPPTNIIHNVKPSARPTSTNVYYIPQVYEMYMNVPSITAWNWTSSNATRYMLLQYFRWYGKCNVANLSYFGMYTLSLRECIFDDSSSVTNLQAFLYQSGINGKIQVDISSATTLASFMFGASRNTMPFNQDTGNATNIASIFSTNSSYAYPLILNLMSVAYDVGTTAFTSMHALPSLRLLNMPVSVTTISVVNTSLSTNALVELFGDLYDRNSMTAGTITITNTAGTASLTTEQRAIAINKNWTIVG